MGGRYRNIRITMPEVNPNESFNNTVLAPAAPTTSPTQVSTAPGLLPGSMSTVAVQTPQNSVGPGNMPSPPIMGSVAGTVTTPQPVSTPSAPVSYMANAAAAGMPGAPSVNPSSAPTSAQIGQKYQNFQSTVQGTEAPATNPSAQIADATQSSTTSDPVFSGLVSSMAPIMNSLNQVISDINNPAITGQSLQSEYNQLSTQYNLPGLNAELMNYQNIMNGTQDDISAEITAGGGTATQSQVLAMTSARNTVILKQYNALATQYQAAQTNVQNMMQYASTDQQTALSKESQVASVTESMDSIYQNMIQMGMTMQQNNATNYRAILTAGGPQSLSDAVAGDPTQQAIAESSLGLAPGTLTNTGQIAQWQADTYKTEQIQLQNYRAAVYGYNAGYTAPNTSYGTATNTIAQAIGTDPTTPLSQVDPSTLVPAIIQNENSQLPASLNNPGDIKFIGAPGQTDSGISSPDGGTFASYGSAQAGQDAIVSDIQSGIQNNPSQTLGQFIDTYTNTAPANSSSTVSPVQTSSQGISYTQNQLVRPSWMAPNVPIYGSASDLQSAAASGKATLDPGTNNYVVKGVGYYVQQPDGSYALNSAIPPNPSQTQSQYQQIQSEISTAQATPASYGPTVTRKWSLSAAAAVKNYVNLPIYQTLSGSSQYLAKIEAAQQDPGSVTDVDLLDSYINLSKGTGQVTESQINGITGGASVADQASVLQQKLENGGILSTNQRQAIEQLSQAVYQNYQTLYQPVYVEAINSMKAQGIPPQFWNVMPDLNQLSQLGQSATNIQ